MIVLSGIGVVATTVFVLGFFGNTWWGFDLVSAYRPQMTVLLGIVGAWLLIVRWWRTGGVTFVAAVVGAINVIPMWIPNPVATNATDELKIISFNLLAANPRFDDVVQFVAESEADLVFLHEASRPWEEAFVNAGLGYEIHNNRPDNAIFATLLLAPPGAEVINYGFELDGDRSVEVHFVHDGVDISVLGIHPLAPTNERYAELRDHQLGQAAEWSASIEHRRIVTGDFNAPTWSWAFRHLQNRSGLHNSQRGFGLGLSFPTTTSVFLRTSIDHLLYSDGLTVVDRVLGPDLGSDHLPLTVTLLVTERS